MDPAADLEAGDDARLVQQCRDGDARAWKALILRYQRLVYAVPRNMGLDDDDCDDVFLETFARLVQWLDWVDRPERVRPWLVTTARRLGLDAVAHRRRQASVGCEATTWVEPAESALDRLERLSERDAVHRALRRLGRRCRELLSLLYRRTPGGSAGYREVSRRLGMPLGSIGPTRARCLNALLVEYRRQGGDR